jgi:hypothetical protein
VFEDAAVDDVESGWDAYDDDYLNEACEGEEDPEAHDWANGYGSDGEVDADALASAGMGTDEDYYCGGGEDY